MPAILLDSRHLGSPLEGNRFTDRLSVGCPSVPVAAMITESNLRAEAERAAENRGSKCVLLGLRVFFESLGL